MFSIRFNARLDTSYHESPHPSKDADVVADSLTDIHSVTVKCFLVVNRSSYTRNLGVFKSKNPEDSYPAREKVMHWVLLYQSIHTIGVTETSRTARLKLITIEWVKEIFVQLQLTNLCFWIYVDKDIFSCFCMRNSCPNFVRSFQLHPVFISISGGSSVWI
jgi:hypothetical protein